MATMGIANGPNYSNRAVGSKAANSRFIPEIWASKLVTKFYASTVLAAISNTDFEGDITKHGDKVIIRTTADIVVNDYNRGMDLNYQTPESPNVELLIDHGKYFAATLDDVDKIQSDIALMDKWATDASEQMKIAVDRDVLGTIFADVASTNTGASAGKVSGSYNLGATGTPLAVTKDNVIDILVDAASVLTEQDVPQEDRWIVIPDWMSNLIKKSDLKDASMTGDGKSILRNGRIGMIDNFTLYVSNLLSASNETIGSETKKATHVIAGHKSALTFASQMTSLETLRNPSRFGDLMRGLQVYGFELIKPDAAVHLYAYKG